MTDTPDAFAYRQSVRRLAPQLEALAAEYAAHAEPFRLALNAALSAPPGGWLDALFDAGGHLARFDLADAAWGYHRPPEADCSDGDLARYSLLRLARAAAARDRPAFDAWGRMLAAEPDVAAEVVAARLEFVMILHARSQQAARQLTVERARDLLGRAGLDLTGRTRFELARAGCALSPAAEDVVGHWADWYSAPAWHQNGLLAPLGARRHLTPGPGGDGESRGAAVASDAPRPSPPARAGVSAATPEQRVWLAALRIYSGGEGEDRLHRAAEVIRAPRLTVDGKLTALHDLIPIPPTTSARTLGEAFGVSHTAVEKSKWWKRHRKHRRKSEVGRREGRLRARAEGPESSGPADEE
jgi:hypothetical protein